MYWSSDISFKLRGSNGILSFADTVAFSKLRWIGHEAIEFYDVKLGDGITKDKLRIKPVNLNLTIIKLFEDKMLISNVEANGKVWLSLYPVERPKYVKLDGEFVDDWRYWIANYTLILTPEVNGEETLEIGWYYVVDTSFSTGWDMLYQYLANGDLIGFFNAIFLIRIGSLWYAILILIPCLAIYMRSKSLTYTSILWILLSSILISMPIPTQAYQMGYIMLALGIAILLFRLYWGWRHG